MVKYLSFGGGVNSVALYLYLLEQNTEFEAVFVDHATDWPETYDYVAQFPYPLTIINPNVEGISSLYDYCVRWNMVPTTMFRWCTSKFKIRPIIKYYQKPCWNLLGFDFGEQKRARLNSQDGIENRFPLIEAEIDRAGCIGLIKRHDLPIPRKSGCFICPFQSIAEWKELRRLHPDLFCKAEQLEKANMEYRINKGKQPLFLYGNAKPLRIVVQDTQENLFEEMQYPPCNCKL